VPSRTSRRLQSRERLENSMQLIIAGYTAAPADPAAAAIYFDRLMQIHEADGLEFAWSGPSTPTLLEPVLAALPPHWTITLNDIPAVWRACSANPHFGLASPDAAGRAAAVQMLREIAVAIASMNARMGRRVVSAIEIHSAPGFDKRVLMPDADALRASLAEIAAIDFHGAAVMLEHCDAFVAGQKPAKGFLPLAAEIAALAGVHGTPVTLGLNWGRSMIELRDADRVLEHVAEGATSGLLRAFTFSGTAAADNAFGEAWLDSHLPFADTLDAAYGEPVSGMTRARAAATLPYLSGCAILAIKTNWPARRTDPLERAASVAANFATLAAVLRTDPRLAGQLRL
jgi:hypothetical protein